MGLLGRADTTTPSKTRKRELIRLVLGTLLVLSICALLPLPGVVSDVKTAYSARMGPSGSREAIWLVEEDAAFQLFSNGLRIENTYATAGARRFYQTLDRDYNMQPSDAWFSQPAGIVYHTTESPGAAFSPDQNEQLRRTSIALATSLSAKQSYNFLIDRFGRTYRLVEEFDAANHAGNSIWAHGQTVYLNLNNSFLAVSFEALTPEGLRPELTPAQLHAGRLLTAMLRARFHIPAEDCVTHAQVSVNPSNMRMGYHTDGANGFPFAALGLPDNYALAPASLTDFGFDYDSAFREAMGGVPWKGIGDAERRIGMDRLRRQTTVEEYRRTLVERYKRLYSALKLTGAMDEFGPDPPS